MASARERIERLAGGERWSEEEWAELEAALAALRAEVLREAAVKLNDFALQFFGDDCGGCGDCAFCIWRLAAVEVRKMADTAEAADRPAKPVLAYGGKGRRLYCLTCPHPESESTPYTADDVDPHEVCARCGRHVIDVAEAGEPR